MSPTASVRRALEGCDAVLHAASVYTFDARRAESMRRDNLASVEAVLGTAHELALDPIVHVSSFAALLPASAPLTPDTPVGRPKGAYNVSKAETELIARDMQREAKRLKVDVLPAREDRLMDRAAPQAVGERLLALVTPQPSSQRIVRRAWRSAQRLGAELDVLIVLSREPSDSEREQIEAFHRLGSLLGARVIVEDGDDVVEAAARVARERRSTYVLIGTPAPRAGLQRLGGATLIERLLRALPGVDLRIVADRSRREWERKR
jgi:hypothetical protein